MKSVSAWIKDPTKYLAYVSRTDEKDILKKMLSTAFHKGELPIRPGDHGKRILDIGCGVGAMTGFLSTLFSGNDIYAIERAPDFLQYAEQHVVNPGNIHFLAENFEDFLSLHFDFILCSHVLQYIDSPLDHFLLLLQKALKVDGESWIIVQEEIGINQIVEAAVPNMRFKNPYFSRWFVHSHVRQRLDALEIPFKTSKFLSYFRAPNFIDPKESDRLCLDFILLDTYEDDNKDLKQSLSTLGQIIVANGQIKHEVGVTRIRH